MIPNYEGNEISNLIQDTEAKKEDYATSTSFGNKDRLWVVRLDEEGWKLKRGTLEDEADYNFYTDPWVENYKRTHNVVKKDSAIFSKTATTESETDYKEKPDEKKKVEKNKSIDKKKVSQKKKLGDKLKLDEKEKLTNKETDEKVKLEDKNDNEVKKSDEQKPVTRKDIFTYMNKLSFFYSKTEPDAHLSDSHENDGPSVALYFKGQLTSLIVTLGMNEWHYFIPTRSPFPAWFYEDHTKEERDGSVEIPEDVKAKFYPELLRLLQTVLRFPM